MIMGEFVTLMNQAENILILPHVSADGDALGSSIALGLALEKKGKRAKIFLEEEIPMVYNVLPGKQLTEVYDGKSSHFDLAISLDTGDMDRLGKRSQLFNGSRVTVNIDHHNTNTEFAFHNFVESGAAAVGEIIFQTIKDMGVALDADISTCLYIAIATDTGGFRFSNTTGKTHQIASELINNGINVAEISQNIFDTTSLGKVKLMGEAINSLEIFEGGKVAIITLTDEMMIRSGSKEEDCDGIVNIGRNIRGVEVAVMLRPKENGEIKANLRSKKYVDVSSIAGLFKGGGHKKAAGFTTDKSMEELKKMLLKDIKEAL